jgi:hypothetical protein
MDEKKQIEKMAKVVRKLTFDLRTNMTSITRYVRHERAKSPTLTEGQFIDRHLEYRELANTAVDNILKCINDNEELRQIESMRFEEGYLKQREGEWKEVYRNNQATVYECTNCNHLSFGISDYCICGAKMKGGAE